MVHKETLKSLLLNTLRKNKIQILVFCLLSFFPVTLLVKAYVPGGGFTKLIFFDIDYPRFQLPEVNQLPDDSKVKEGYDGQFYAQIALVPYLEKEVLVNVIDSPAYRSRRIGMPMLANLLSFGNEKWVLYWYAVLPIAFWFVFLIFLLKSSLVESRNGLMILVAIMLSSGTLVSIGRALPDFPALVLSYFALHWSTAGLLGALMLSIAVLFKETTILSFLILLPLNFKARFSDFFKLVSKGLLILLPFTLWMFYIASIYGWDRLWGLSNFSYPGEALYFAIKRNIRYLMEMKSSLPFDVVLHSIALLSLCVQMFFMFAHRKIHSPFWRFGIGFAILLPFLGRAVFADVHAYSRVVLPLTLAFNFLLFEISKEKRSRVFITWYILGNIGLFGTAIEIINYVF
jgi:hypothetical protein